MAGEKHTVIFSRDGATVQEKRRAPLTDDTRTVTIDELDWDSFPMDLLMEVNDVEPVPSESDEAALSELRFTVSRLERPSAEDASETDAEFWDRVEAETGISQRDGEISLSGDKSAKNNLVEFVEFLVDHQYLTVDDLPVKSGWKRYLINTERVHQGGDEMAQGVKIAENIFLETKYSREDIRKKIRELAERFGE